MDSRCSLNWIELCRHLNTVWIGPWDIEEPMNKCFYLNINLYFMIAHLIQHWTLNGQTMTITVIICQNSTNNPKQLKTTFVVRFYFRLKKTPHHHQTNTPGLIKFMAVLDNLGTCKRTSFFGKWKTTSSFPIEDEIINTK